MVELFHVFYFVEKLFFVHDFGTGDYFTGAGRAGEKVFDFVDLVILPLPQNPAFITIPRPSIQILNLMLIQLDHAF